METVSREYVFEGYDKKLVLFRQVFSMSSESDVYRRQILTTKVDPRAVRVNSQ